jgi:hypothetical protein
MKNTVIDTVYLADDKHLLALSENELNDLIVKINDSQYEAMCSQYGYFCFCPTCDKFRMTDRCACMCGSCYTCGYRWTCMPPTTIYPTGRPFVWTI